MRRIVSVPATDCINGKIPQEALNLARNTLLEIEVSDDYTSIGVHPIPELRFCNHPEVVEKGFIFSVDLIDEFTDLSKDIYLEVCDNKAIPKILEKHKAVFRTRLETVGKHHFRITSGGEDLYFGEVEVVG